MNPAQRYLSLDLTVPPGFSRGEPLTSGTSTVARWPTLNHPSHPSASDDKEPNNE